MSFTADVALATINAISWGLTLALIALGLNLIFGLLNIVNISHGSLYMLGAFLGWYTIDVTGSFLLALLIAPLAVSLVGVAMERIALRPIEDDVSITVIATFGLAIALQYAVVLVFGPGTRTVDNPVSGVVKFGVTFSRYRLVIAGVSLLVMAALYLFLTRTRYGMWMRGVRQDREVAAAMGVPTSWVYMLTFGLGAYFAAFAGVLLAPIVSVNYLMGMEILAIAFVVVMVGGLGSLAGVLIVSILFSLLENFGALFVPTMQARILALILLISILVVRPEGILDRGTHA
jgi:branched-chain amino acid transport system permease protein